MPIAAAAARVIFTVDVDAGYPASDLPGLRQIETAACRLIDCFRRRQLLATTNQVNHIASELGYEDPSYFFRFFRKHTGYSPQSYRNNFK